MRARTYPPPTNAGQHSRTLTSGIYSQLKEMLISGQLIPGEPLSLRSLAADLGVSVMPIREAIQRLAAERALEVLPNRTIRVPRMSEETFREITEIRKNIEGFAVARASKLITEAELALAEKAQARFSEELKKRNPNRTGLILDNKKLHFTIYKAARMPTLLALIEVLWMRIGPILNYDLRTATDRVQQKPAVLHHDHLLTALRCRDGLAASLALEGDIDSAARFIIIAGDLITSD